MRELQNQMVQAEEACLPIPVNLKSERVQDEAEEPAEKRRQVKSTVLVMEIAVASRAPAEKGLSAPQKTAVTVHGRRRFRSGSISEVVEFAVKLG
ncbi:MAG TPA: hypothetical protein VE078_07180 [Thermoanaerobaculia bacterium]|nr:hypothetical protein [Thermoanaerobaculia bacterium]